MKKLIDFYELTMEYTDLKNKKDDEICYFDVFFRKNLDNGGYNVVCGLEEIINYIKNLRFDEEDIEYLRSLNQFDEEYLEKLRNFKFTGDIYAVPDGTIMFPNEPCITVRANAFEAQIIETDLLNFFNHGSLIATRARRITNAAGHRGVMEFGARRAQGADAAVNGAKYAYISGCIGTSCYETGKKYGVPILGTMAHSHIMKYDTEYEAFLAYAKCLPNNTTFIVDTYDTLKSGVPNAIKVAKDFLIPNGYTLKGIRLDSGDLAYLSKEARKMLDEAGLTETKICVSNSLDEYTIKSLIEQGAPIDSFGVGENLITSKSMPVFGGVYKLSAIEKENQIIPKIKVSENVGKITNPGFKKVLRFYDKNTGLAIADSITTYDEEVNKERYTIINDKHEFQTKELKNYTVRELQVPIFLNGHLVYKVPTLEETRQYAKNEFNTLYEECKRLHNPHIHHVGLSKELLDLKKKLLLEARTQTSQKELTLKKGK
jgi:nicotinate phosphoribosyltransferase